MKTPNNIPQPEIEEKLFKNTDTNETTHQQTTIIPTPKPPLPPQPPQPPQPTPPQIPSQENNITNEQSTIPSLQTNFSFTPLSENKQTIRIQQTT